MCALQPPINDAFIIAICRIYAYLIIEISQVLTMNSASHPWRRCRAPKSVAFTLFAPKSYIRPQDMR
jgi:hypothetical protein